MPDARMLDRAALRAYLGNLPWAEIETRMGAGRIPRPLWSLDAADKKARWDRRAVDRALDEASALPAHIEARDASILDAAFGHRR